MINGEKHKTLQKEFIKLLIVDDDTAILNHLKFSLEDEFEIFLAENAREGMGIIQYHNPDIALIDVHLPPHMDSIKDGIRLIREIHLFYPQIKIIAMSADDKKEIIDLCIKNGAVKFFPKPFDLKEFYCFIKG